MYINKNRILKNMDTLSGDYFLKKKKGKNNKNM